VRQPSEPILARIRELSVRAPSAGMPLPPGLTPEQVLLCAGGIAGMPSIHVSHSLARTRLRDERYRTDSNDQIDEWHASYAPYVAAMALDRRTAARFQDAGLPHAAKVTHRLQDIPAILSDLLRSAPVRRS